MYSVGIISLEVGFRHFLLIDSMIYFLNTYRDNTLGLLNCVQETKVLSLGNANAHYTDPS